MSAILDFSSGKHAFLKEEIEISTKPALLILVHCCLLQGGSWNILYGGWGAKHQSGRLLQMKESKLFISNSFIMIIAFIYLFLRCLKKILLMISPSFCWGGGHVASPLVCQVFFFPKKTLFTLETSLKSPVHSKHVGFRCGSVTSSHVLTAGIQRRCAS